MASSEKQNLMARNIWPLVQNRSDEEWTKSILRNEDLLRRGSKLTLVGWVFVCVCVCPRTFVNSSGSAKPIRAGQTPFDAPKRRNDDGVGHVAPRATWHVPRAAA